MPELLLIVAASLTAIISAAFVIRYEVREHRRRLFVRDGAAMIERGLAQMDRPPQHVIPQPRTKAEHRSRDRWGMGGLAAVPVLAWARDHHVPTMLAVAAVGGVLTYTPSLSPHVTPLPPQADAPTVTAPPLEPRPAPPTEPDAETEADVEQSELPPTRGQPGQPQPPDQAQGTPRGRSAEPGERRQEPAPGPRQPVEPEQEPRQQPDEPEPPSQPPPCLEVGPPPDIHVPACVDDVSEVVSSAG